MARKQYMKGKPVETIRQFDECGKTYFIVKFGESTRTLHRGFLEAWKYGLLKNFIRQGRVYEAEKIEY